MASSGDYTLAKIWQTLSKLAFSPVVRRTALVGAFFIVILFGFRRFISALRTRTQTTRARRDTRALPANNAMAGVGVDNLDQREEKRSDLPAASSSASGANVQTLYLKPAASKRSVCVALSAISERGHGSKGFQLDSQSVPVLLTLAQCTRLYILATVLDAAEEQVVLDALRSAGLSTSEIPDHVCLHV